MSIASYWKWPVLLCALSACSAPNLTSREVLSQSHVDEQGGYLSSAISHLQAAHDRLASEPDPHQAGLELEAGRASVGMAQGDNQKIDQDIHDLAQSEAAAREKSASLQREIDSHRNDLLGPRARRIRNRLIVISVLLGIGWSLLKLAPLFGGPLGGGILVLGHVLTGFIRPLLGLLRSVLGMLWRGLVALIQRIVAALEKLGNANSTMAAPVAAGGG